MNSNSLLLFFVLLTGMFSCQKPFLNDDEQSIEAAWEPVDFQSERLIQALHATPFEWYAITENEFARFDGENKLLEKRPLATNFGVDGIAALSDNTFVRLTTDQDSRQVLEFHLARNPTEVIKILADSLRSPNDDFLEIEPFSQSSLGAFSPDGTLFLLPTTIQPGDHYVLLLFEVLHNPAHTAFTSLEIIKRVDLPDLNDAASSNINTVRFLDGNFYVTSKEGAWRISPSGNEERIFQQWMLDFFSWQGELYATGINSFDLHKSTDNGMNWERLNQNSALKFVQTAGENIFTQTALGLLFSMMEEDLLMSAGIEFPLEFGPNDVIYYDVIFFTGNYYFCLDREVYMTDKIVKK